MSRAHTRTGMGHRARACGVVAVLLICAVGLVAAGSPAQAAAPAGVSANFAGPGIAMPNQITVGPDGNLWFTNYGNSAIGRITPAGALTAFTDPGVSSPYGITPGPDGNLWFTDSGTNSIGRLTTTGTFTSFTAPGIVYPQGITAGPDGNLWFTNVLGGSVGRITTAGAITIFAHPSISLPYEIAAGPDGNVWFTDYGSNSVNRITPSGSIATFTAAGVDLPRGLAAGPDGNIWFANSGADSLGRITPSGVITILTGPGISRPAYVAPGPDGNMWFTNDGINSIGRITPAGAVTIYQPPTMSGPTGIVAGPDGNMWFTNQGNSTIGWVGTGEPVSGHIDGVVDDGRGGVAGVVVTLMAEWPSWVVVASTTTDAAGRYTLPVTMAGSYRVRFVDPSGAHQRTWYPSRPTYKTATPIIVSVDAPAARVDQALAPAAGNLFGRARTAAALGVPGIRVLVYAAASGYAAGTTTGANGYYQFRGLPPGAYFIQFVDPSHRYRQRWWPGEALFPAARTVTVASGDTWADIVMS